MRIYVYLLYTMGDLVGATVAEKTAFDHLKATYDQVHIWESGGDRVGIVSLRNEYDLAFEWEGNGKFQEWVKRAKVIGIIEP